MRVLSLVGLCSVANPAAANANRWAYMTRLCGNCSRPCKKHGEPRRNGSFIDQIVTCPKCGWCGVETEIVEHEEFIQLDMFSSIDLSGVPDAQRGANRVPAGGADGEQADGVADDAGTGSGAGGVCGVVARARRADGGGEGLGGEG